MPTFVIQMEGSGTGLTSPAATYVGMIVAQPHLSLNVTRVQVIEPNNVGVPSTGGTAETSVVY